MPGTQTSNGLTQGTIYKSTAAVTWGEWHSTTERPGHLAWGGRRCNQTRQGFIKESAFTQRATGSVLGSKPGHSRVMRAAVRARALRDRGRTEGPKLFWSLTGKEEGCRRYGKRTWGQTRCFLGRARPERVSL